MVPVVSLFRDRLDGFCSSNGATIPFIRYRRRCFGENRCDHSFAVVRSSVESRPRPQAAFIWERSVNVLVTSSPKDLAGDVGSLRGLTHNLAAAVGTAVVGALLVGILSSIILGNLAENPAMTAELKDEVNLTNLNFFSDAQLKERLAGNTATPEHLAEALAINAEARTRALKIGFLALSGLALLAIFPVQLAAGSQAR